MLSSGRWEKVCRRGCLVSALAALALAVLPVAAGGAARHVVAVTRHPITGLAFDEARLAWSTRCGGLHSVVLPTRAGFAALRCPRPDHPRLLALGGRLAALFSVTGRTGRVVTTFVDRAMEPVRRPRASGFPAPAARGPGGGSPEPPATARCWRGRSCGNGPREPAPAHWLDAWDFRPNQLVARNRLAIVPAKKGVAVQPTVPVEVFGDLVDTPVATFSPMGSVRAVAVFKTRVVVLVRSAGAAKRISWYDRDTGGFVDSVAVPASTAPSIDATASRVVYQVGNEIWTLRLSDGHTQRVFTARATPRRVLIEGNVVAWYTTARGRSVVSTLNLGPA